MLVRVLLLRNQVLRQRAHCVQPRVVRRREQVLQRGRDELAELRLADGRETSDARRASRP